MRLDSPMCPRAFVSTEFDDIANPHEIDGPRLAPMTKDEEEWLMRALVDINAQVESLPLMFVPGSCARIMLVPDPVRDAVLGFRNQKWRARLVVGDDEARDALGMLFREVIKAGAEAHGVSVVPHRGSLPVLQLRRLRAAEPEVLLGGSRDERYVRLGMYPFLERAPEYDRDIKDMQP